MKSLLIGLLLVISCTSSATPLKIASPFDVTISIVKHSITIPLVAGGHKIQVLVNDGTKVNVIETNCNFKYKFSLKGVKQKLEQVVEQAKLSDKMVAINNIELPLNCHEQIMITDLNIGNN